MKEKTPMAEGITYDRKNCQIFRYKNVHKYMLREKKSDPWEKVRGVTTYTGLIDKPGLRKWYAEIALKYIINRPEKEFLALLKELKDEQARKAFFEVALKAPDEERDKAADIGKQAHKAIELFCRGQGSEIDFDRLEPEAVNCYNQFLAWAEDEKYIPIRVEEPVASIGGWYVGTPDGEGTVTSKKTLCMLDHKTGKGIWPEMLAQAGGYWRAQEESFGGVHDKFFILNFNKENWAMVVEEFDRKQMRENVRYFNSLLPAFNFHDAATKELKRRYKERKNG